MPGQSLRQGPTAGRWSVALMCAEPRKRSLRNRSNIPGTVLTDARAIMVE